MGENELATVVVDAAWKVHQTLGPGLLETVYEAALAHELQKAKPLGRQAAAYSRDLRWPEI